MRLIVKLDTTGKYKVYFDGMPNFFGEGTTREEALRDFKEKINAVMEAYANIIKDM